MQAQHDPMVETAAMTALMSSSLAFTDDERPVVDTAENIERILPMVDEMVGDGMVTVERVEVMTYRARGRKSEQVADRLRMLAEEARPLVGSPDREHLLAASIHAAHDYGATEKQIAEASRLPVTHVRRIIESRRDED